jgi:GTP-binding protein YchF
VVRAFEDGDVVHVDGKVSPASDIETIHTELILADLQTLEKAVPRLEKEARIKKESKPLLDNAVAAQKVLEEGNTLYAAGAAAGVDLAEARSLGLLTTKPFIYVFNLDEDQLADAELHASLRSLVEPADSVFLNAKLEVDLMEMEPDEAMEMLESFGAEESGLTQLARTGFHTLGLQTYLTAGPKEARAWTIRQGWTAPQAAGVIHTDFQRGFIKAEIVSYADLDAAGSMAAAKAAGKVRMEGKEYVMQDGDVVEFRFNN